MKKTYLRFQFCNNTTIFMPKSNFLIELIWYKCTTGGLDNKRISTIYQKHLEHG